MYCPRCGQQQVSENIKFCSRCGFLMELVPEILAGGGVLPQLLNLNQNKKLLTRKNGLKAALIWAIVMWLLLLPFFGMIGADELTGLAAILGFAGAVLITAVSFMFLENKPAVKQTGVSTRSDYAHNNLGGASSNALPPQQSVPASAYVPPAGKWQTTNDLTAPPSVTDSTTKLLQKDE